MVDAIFRQIPLRSLISTIVDNRGKTPPWAVGELFELIETTSIVGKNKYPDYSLVQKWVSKDIFENWFRSGHPQAKDILIATVGANIGNVAIMREARGSVAQNLVGLRIDTSQADPEYVYYFLSWGATQEKLKSLNIGAAQPSIRVPHLLETEVSLPPLPEQRAIARILGKLDDKIELNRRMNITLESMAQALFKSWFVDFDPVTKNAECGMQNDELFPAEFVDSELGAIPMGWKVGRLSELANVNPTTLKSDYPHKEIEYIDIASVEVGNLTTTMRVELKNAPSRAKRLVKHGDTIWSCVRPNRKSYLLIQQPEPNVVVSTGFAVLSPKIPCHSFIYLWVITDDFVDYLTAHAEGSAYPAVRPESFERAPILIPSADILSAFEKKAKPLFELRNKNERQSRTLASIRDALLPRLLSGEVRVKG